MLEPFPLNCKRIGVALKQVATCGLQTFVPDSSWGKLFTAQPLLASRVSSCRIRYLCLLTATNSPGSEPSLQYRSRWNIPPYCMARHNAVRSRLFLSFWCCRDALMLNIHVAIASTIVLEEFFTCPFRACKTRGDQSGTGHVSGIGPQQERAWQAPGTPCAAPAGPRRHSSFVTHPSCSVRSGVVQWGGEAEAAVPAPPLVVPPRSSADAAKSPRKLATRGQLGIIVTTTRKAGRRLRTRADADLPASLPLSSLLYWPRFWRICTGNDASASPAARARRAVDQNTTEPSMNPMLVRGYTECQSGRRTPALNTHR